MIVLNQPASIFKAIEAIAADSSKKAKEEGVKAILGVPLGRRILLACYSQFRIYGIGKHSVPQRTAGIAPGANTLSEDLAWTILEQLENRELTGDAARAAVQKAIDFLEPASSELFRRILMKDMRAGFTDGTMNRVERGLLPEFPYMRCTLPAKSNMDKWDWNEGIIVQEKADGCFANVNNDGAVIWLTTRQGTDIPLDNLPELHAAIKHHLPAGYQCHGELTVWEHYENLPGGARDDEWHLMNREDSNGVMNHINAGGSLAPNQRIRLDVWDAIPLSAVVPKGRYTVPYKQRLSMLLKSVLAGPGGCVKVITTKIVKSKAEAWAYYRELLKKGREGVICKHPTSEWVDTSGGNKDVVKLKLKAPAEYRVTGFNMGGENSKNKSKISSLQVATECDRMRFNVTCRGDKMIAEVTADPESWRGAIITVEGNSIQEPEDDGYYALYLPVFVERRNDRSEADTLDRVREQFQAAMEAA